MMVAVYATEHFDRHAQRARGLPHIDALLHHACRSRVAKNVGRYVGAKPRGFCRRPPRVTHFLDSLAVVVDNESIKIAVKPAPAS